ncbi:MAG: glycosyltransferase family 2 protein [Chthoniobacterales bacterium]
MKQALRSWVHCDAEAATESGLLRVDGWVFAEGGATITQVRARALSKTWPAIHGVHRPDVAAAFPDESSAKSSGFTLEVAVKPGAQFELILEAEIEGGAWQKFLSRTIKIPRGAMRFWRPRFASVAHTHIGYFIWLDEPKDWHTLPSRFRISGWCFSKTNQALNGIRASLGRKSFHGNYGIFRADVAEGYEERSGAFGSGFEIVVEAPRGWADLRIEVRQVNGAWEEVFVRRIHAPWINLRPIGNAQLWEIGDYQTWLKRYTTLRPADRRQIKTHIANFTSRPLLSLVMPVYNPSPDHLKRALDSVRAQLYAGWELCVVDDASTTPHVRKVLERYAKRDRRIKVRYLQENAGIAQASNEALSLVTGAFVALLDHDDELVPEALYFVALEILQHPDVQLIYSDEDKLDITGRRGNPHFKPDWNGPLFLTQNYFSHLGVFRAELIKSVGFRAGFEGSQDYDLVLRCLERVDSAHIRHIPRILYHWRMTAQSAALSFHAKPHAREAATRAVREHLQRRQIAAEVTSSGDEDFRRIRYQLPNDKPRVTIIMPTRDMVEMLQPCVESILQQTTYPNYELLLVDNDSQTIASLDFLRRVTDDQRVRVVRYAGDFNFGRLNNFGVSQVGSVFVALLNNDLRVITPDWLEEMVGQALQPGVGAVGARLLYPDDHIQHAGVILGGGGVAGHAHKGLPAGNHGYFARAILVQELSAVTAACLLLRRKAYLESGGFDEEHLKIAFNDVDFCLRLRRRGYRIVYTPYAEFYHEESASRGFENTVAKDKRFKNEIQCMHDRWGEMLLQDPAYNPNLSLISADFTLAFPPRLTTPWAKQ